MKRPILAIVLVAACSAPETTGTESTTSTEEATSAASTTTATAILTTTTTRATTTTTPIVLENFTIELIVIESTCFNTAGANVTAEPELTVDVPLPDDYQATLVYEVHGGESVDIANLEIDGDEYTSDNLLLSTPSCDYELRAEPVRLIER